MASFAPIRATVGSVESFAPILRWQTARWLRSSHFARSTSHVGRHFGMIGFVRYTPRAALDCHSGSIGFVFAAFNALGSRAGQAIDPRWIMHDPMLLCM
jgi:hypothetical protein